MSGNVNNNVVGNIVTLPVIEQGAPGLLQNSIDERIVKVRPMSTPIDQISRCGGSRKATAMTVEYYIVDSKATETKTTAAFTGYELEEGDETVISLTVANSTLFESSETVLVPSVEGDGGPLMLYVLGRDRSTTSFLVVNPPKVGGALTLPSIATGTTLVRMGRAATELDVQTAQFAVLPKKATNNCQIFKMQVEQSTLAKLARKEVGWNFSDQEEAAIIDMRLGMEKNFLFGTCAKIYDDQKKETVYLTGGIWQQAKKDFDLLLDNLDEDTLVDLCATAFTGHNGSKRKILIAGTELMQALSHLQFSKTLSAGETFAKWGVEFREIRSNFGSLYVLHSEVFDQCGHGKDGFILDPDYMTKYVHVPFRADTLDLRSTGVRNTDAVVLTEASCLVLRFPEAHVRVHGA